MSTFVYLCTVDNLSSLFWLFLAAMWIHGCWESSLGRTRTRHLNSRRPRCFSGHPKDYCWTGRLDACFEVQLPPWPLFTMCLCISRLMGCPAWVLDLWSKFPSLDRSRTGANRISGGANRRVRGSNRHFNWFTLQPGLRRTTDFLDWNRISTFPNIPPTCCAEPSVFTAPNLLFCLYRTIYVYDDKLPNTTS